MSPMGIFEFNNSLDRPSPKLFYGILLKYFRMRFHVCIQKYTVPFINKYTYIGDTLKLFLIGVHDQKCLETISVDYH